MDESSYIIRQSDGKNTALEREFGWVILRDREWWRRIMEPVLLAIFWYGWLNLLTISMIQRRGSIEFLAQAVQIIGWFLSTLVFVVGVAITVFYFCFRPVMVGKKHLKGLRDDGNEYRFREDCLTVAGMQEQSEFPYASKIFECLWVGRNTYYLKTINLPVYFILEKSRFIAGDFDSFPEFAEKKMGIPLRYTKKISNIFR